MMSETMKRCSRCGVEKELARFWKDRHKPNGLGPACRECYAKRRATPEHREKTRARWAANRERERMRDRKRNAHRGPQKVDLVKHRARLLLHEAVRRGWLAKPPACSSCYEPTPAFRLHGHHHLGYDAPLDVEWLCSLCHGTRHRKAA